MNGLKQKWMPHLLAIALFVVLSVGFFPQVYNGYVLRQGDIISWVGMSRAIEDFRAAYDQEPLWTWSAFSGMPAYLISTKASGNLIGVVISLKKAFPAPVYFFLAMMVSMYILFMALKIKPNLATLGAVAFAFSSFFIISIEAGHNTKIHAVAYLPLILAGVVHLWNKHYLLSGVVFSIGLSLQLMANHYQVTYYTAIIVAIIALFVLTNLIKEKQFDTIWKSALVLVVGSVLALATNSTKLWSTYEYSKSSTRGKSELTKTAEGTSNATSQSGALDKDYITTWSQGIGETWSLVFPNAKGGPTGALGAYPDALKDVSSQYRQYVAQSNAYWGDQPGISGPVYVGAIIALLFLLGAVTVKHWLKIPLIVITILAIALSWGKNMMWLTELFIDYFPIYNKFRTVTMWLMVAEFTMPLMAILFLHQLFTEADFWKTNKKKLFITAGTSIGVLLLFLITPDSFFDFQSQREVIQFQNQMAESPQQAGQFQQLISELETARVSLFRSDLLRSIGLMLLTIIGILAFVFNKLKSDALVYILLALVALDLWTVDKRYINSDKERGEYENWISVDTKLNPYPVRQVDLGILQREIQANPEVQTRIQSNLGIARNENSKMTQADEYKVMFSTLDSMSNYRVLDMAINTFNTAQTSFYHKSIGGYHAAKMKRYKELIDFHINRGSGNIDQGVVNMLNTKYVIMPGQEPSVQQNPNASGNAWFVPEIQWVANADDEINALKGINPISRAIIDQRFKADVKEQFGQGTINLTVQKLNYMAYEVDAQSDAFAIFSEIYYQPGWNTYIDGEPAPHVRVNYVLRGMNVPGGKHTIEFKFEPQSFYVARSVSYASSILILLGGLMLLVQRFRPANNE